MTEAAGKPLSKEAIVNETVRLLVEHGLTAVSLRRIATGLGVSAPTLYWYIANKRELLDRVAEHLLRDASVGVADRPAPGQPWWEWLDERSRAVFDVMVSVRDAPLVVAGNRPTVDMLPGVDTALGELVAAGFSAAEAQQVFFVIGAYVGGMALEYQAEDARVNDRNVDDSELREAVRQGDRYPYVTAALQGREGHEPTAFEYGLDLIIRGARSRLTEVAGSRDQEH